MDFSFSEFFTGAIDYMSKPFFELGKTPISVLTILTYLLVIAGFILLNRILRRTILRQILMRMGVDEGRRYTYLRIFSYVFMILGAVIAFQFVGIDLSSLVVIFGALSVGIGFGLQNITSNFISGLIILFERPIQVGDRVTVNDLEGDVTNIRMRSTTIRSLDNISIIVPNLDFVEKHVINWSYGDPKIRLNVKVGVSYGSDVDLVIDSMLRVAAEHPEVLKDPEPDVLLDDFGDSAWNMRLRCWIADPMRHPVVQSDLNIAIVRIFRKNNIEIPFPQRDLNFRGPLPLPLDVASGTNKEMPSKAGQSGRTS